MKEPSRQKFSIQSFIKKFASDDSFASILSLKILSVKILFELNKRTAPVFNIILLPETANRTHLAVQKILQILTKFSHIIYFICIVMSVPIPKINRILVGKINYQFSISMKNFNICKQVLL